MLLNQNMAPILKKAEICRLKLLKKIIKPIFETKQKQSKQKNREKAQAKVDKASTAVKESEANAMQEILNNAKPLEDLKKRANELKRQNDEDQAFVQDENTSPS